MVRFSVSMIYNIFSFVLSYVVKLIVLATPMLSSIVGQKHGFNLISLTVSGSVYFEFCIKISQS